MKHVCRYLPLGLVVLAVGCASNREQMVLDPVGPAPGIRASRSSDDTPSPEGSLTVFSAWDAGAPGDQSDVIVNHHSDYRIYSSDGKLFKRVNNFVGTFIEYPATISLLPGRYTVAASVATLGLVKVPVVIETGKITSVHLDGSDLRTGKRTSASDTVRLPNGWAVGWGANTNGETK